MNHHASSSSSSFLEDVTARFAKSMTLATSGAAPKLGFVGGGTIKRSNQFYLIGRPLTSKPLDKRDFHATMHRKWRTQKSFQIQARAGDTFLFSFPNKRDRRKMFQVLERGVTTML